MKYEILWKDRKRPFLGLPWSFTKYALTKEKLFITTGVFNKTEEEIRLYRIMDVTLKRSFGERLLGIGTICCNSADKSTPRFEIRLVRRPKDVKDMLSDLVEEQRDAKRVSSREFMTTDSANSVDDDIDCHDGYDDDSEAVDADGDGMPD